MTERIHKAYGLEKDYLVLRNADVQRKDLSYEAVGVLVYLLSLPTTWEIHLSTLERKGMKRDKIRRVMKELSDNGYAALVKDQNEKGIFEGSHYEIFAIPEQNPYLNRETEKPSVGKNRVSVKQQLEKKEKAVEKKDPKPQEQLALVLGKTLASGDWGNYGKVCKTLSASGINPDSYADYYGFIQKLSKAQGNWEITVNSLVTNGRMSDYLTSKQKEEKVSVVTTTPTKTVSAANEMALFNKLAQEGKLSNG